MIIDGLVTDRTQADVNRVEELAAIGWRNMTPLQKKEWLYGKNVEPLFWSDGEEIICADGPLYAYDSKQSNKGAYNATDLNRVGEAMIYLAERFTSYGYSVRVSPKTDWDEEDIPSESQMAHYLEDLTSLRGVIQLLHSTPDVPPDMEFLTFEEANDIEQILFDIGLVIERVIGSFRRLNSFNFYSGADPLPSAQSDFGRTWDEIDDIGATWGDLDSHNTDWYIISYGVLK